MYHFDRSAPGALRQKFAAVLITTFCLCTTGEVRAQCETASGVLHRASDGGSQDKLGGSVAVGGGFAVLGSPGHPAFTETGAVYILASASGSWAVAEKLTASDGAVGDRFGFAVATDGEWALIGAEGASSAYIFRNVGGSWVEYQKLVPPESAPSFGFAVSLSGNTAVVGAYGALTFSGKAYVYSFDGASWNLAQTLSASGGAAYDFFGTAVAVSGNAIAVGAYGQDTGGTNTGTVYLYRASGNGWLLEQTLKPSDVAAGDSFGRVLAMSGDFLVSGSPRHDAAGTDSGAAYVYWFGGNSWTLDVKLIGSDTAPGDKLGTSVAISGSVIVVGSPYWDDATGITNRGAAYPFAFDGTSWNEQAKLIATSPYGWYDDSFANSVAVADGVAVAGAQLADGPGRDAGHVYTFDMQCAGSTTECVNSIDCNDNNICTTDTCSGGTCSYANNSVSCNDGNACTTSDTCSAGSCSGLPLNCDDGIACTVDSCSQGTCVNNSAACECVGSADCDDGNSCTFDRCSSGSCTHANISGACNDGDACTTNDTCSAGLCTGVPVDCDDGLACTVDSCLQGACVNDAAACDCMANLDCNDGIACTVDVCTLGVCSNNASACECIAHSDCNDGNACTSDFCSNGSCSHLNMTGLCDDGDACTTNDTCSAGTCGGSPLDCNDGVVCTIDSCVAGICIHNDTICDCIANADCNDGIACTADTCVAGSCRNDATACECSVDSECSDGNLCTADLCGSDRMCQHNMRSECCGNGVCEKDEDSCTCSSDCEDTRGAVCGNGTCEAGDGENCITCPSDCNGQQGGLIVDRFCCGSGGYNPISCDDQRCYDRSVSCTAASVAEPCCGNGVCESYESGCFCPEDCGAPLPFERAGVTCQDGMDNDCDGLVDCDDPDCKKEELCWTCNGNGICDPGEDCRSCPTDCDGMARGRRMQRFCCGNGVREPAERNPQVCNGNP